MIHNLTWVVGVANDQHREIGSCRLPIAVRLSTERLHCTHGIGQQAVCRKTVFHLVHLNDTPAVWEILCTGAQTCQCRISLNLRALGTWRGRLITQGAQLLHVVRLGGSQPAKGL